MDVHVVVCGGDKTETVMARRNGRERKKCLETFRREQAKMRGRDWVYNHKCKMRLHENIFPGDSSTLAWTWSSVVRIKEQARCQLEILSREIDGDSQTRAGENGWERVREGT